MKENTLEYFSYSDLNSESKIRGPTFAVTSPSWFSAMNSDIKETVFPLTLGSKTLLFVGG